MSVYCDIDGMTYPTASDVPDYGSIRLYSKESSGRRHFCLLEADISKLPTTAPIVNMSDAFVNDKQSVKTYLNGAWY